MLQWEKRDESSSPPTNQLIIKRLKRHSTEDEIRAHFGKYAEWITHIKIPRNSGNVYAFVTFTSDDTASTVFRNLREDIKRRGMELEISMKHNFAEREHSRRRPRSRSRSPPRRRRSPSRSPPRYDAYDTRYDRQSWASRSSSLLNPAAESLRLSQYPPSLMQTQYGHPVSPEYQPPPLMQTRQDLPLSTPPPYLRQDQPQDQPLQSQPPFQDLWDYVEYIAQGMCQTIPNTVVIELFANRVGFAMKMVQDLVQDWKEPRILLLNTMQRIIDSEARVQNHLYMSQFYDIYLKCAYMFYQMVSFRPAENEGDLCISYFGIMESQVRID
jgi:hypothetical protein